MFESRLFASIVLLACVINISVAQNPPAAILDPARQPITYFDTAALPGEQLPLGILLDESIELSAGPGTQPLNLRELMWPTFNLSAEWLGEASGVEIGSYDVSVQIPTYPFFGPPPPFLNAGFSYTNLSAPTALGLPTDLYDYSLGFSWIRPLSDQWTLRLMFSTALATDGQNNSSDAWQFRGGAFAMYQPNQQWTWLVGAIALGRSDLPAVPAVGAIWQPNAGWKFDLIMPKPKIAMMLVDNGPRQQWAYVGGGFDGGTWAYQRWDGVDDRITYRDWRVMLGWESIPAAVPGVPFTRGRKLAVEIGYSFAREFEFDSGTPDINLDHTWLLRASASF